MAVSKRLRYEVLRRDNYTCRYCGRSAPGVEITVDHVIPRALGGGDEPSNLCAACRGCNDGKTSSSPDAPLVADVAEDALKWAQAMQAATARMLADLDAREAGREQFREWWNNWGYGDGEERRTVPLEAGWQQTVDQLTSAGLPSRVLKDCVDLSMGRSRVVSDQKFRYMCGVAWKKLTELQDAARALGAGETPKALAGGTQGYNQGRGDLARKLLGEITDEEREYYVTQADLSEYQDELDAPQTADDLACDAISSALNSVRCDWHFLCERIEAMLNALPGDIGARALEMRPDSLREMAGPLGRRTFHLTDAMTVAGDLLYLPAALEYLGPMTDAERAEWHAFAAALYDRANLSGDELTSRAGYCAKSITEGGYWDSMCIGRGEAIAACPKRGTNHARITGAKCCGPDGPEGHKGHVVCDRHLEELIEGTFLSLTGRPLSATDYAAVGSDPWDF